MKTETQIAQKKIDEIRDTVAPTQKGILKEQSKELKEKDQRFLEFLEEEMKRWETIQELLEESIYLNWRIRRKNHRPKTSN